MNEDKAAGKIGAFFIEISGRCQAKCPYCLRERFQSRHSGEIMSPNLFEEILGHLSAIGLLKKGPAVINLFNWGEPFLNPQLEDILFILKKKRLRAGISSNFFKLPTLNDTECLSAIQHVMFSISGFSQKSYGRIHGGSLERVLQNFEKFYSMVLKYVPDIKININWHRYVFNEHELWDAYKYFQRPGIYFSPMVAYFNDPDTYISFAEGNLNEGILKKAEEDLFLHDLTKQIKECEQLKEKGCPVKDWLVIDETGELLLCCMHYRDHPAVPSLGDIRQMSADEIWNKKFSKNELCRKCSSSGVMAVYSRKCNRPLPINLGRDCIVCWYKSCYDAACISIKTLIDKLPINSRIRQKLKAPLKFLNTTV
jgi:MoaA/NifB/PqqE/SkfB family radical SAM enzyme